MEIDYLADRPDHLETVARWHHDEWSALRGGQSLEECRRELQATMTRGDFPTTVVAVDDDEVVGSASLVESAMETRPDRRPWLAGVYVADEHRNRGIGSLLVERITDEAAAHGFSKIFLFTTGSASLYARLGWERLTDDEYHGHTVAVMRRDL